MVEKNAALRAREDVVRIVFSATSRRREWKKFDLKGRFSPTFFGIDINTCDWPLL